MHLNINNTNSGNKLKHNIKHGRILVFGWPQEFYLDNFKIINFHTFIIKH